MIDIKVMTAFANNPSFKMDGENFLNCQIEMIETLEACGIDHKILAQPGEICSL